ncbi:cyclase family protein [Microbacterium yannicii]|uniref:Cyclase family protein n=1 Tax=Microbacterium yannicii TaxID=671622 RepID=A0ABP9M738_9MICO|nr:cyclase family protein [Microbacterium yannicii]MCO5952455.1 cyclase family protein [Microbacterium yannicii]
MTDVTTPAVARYGNDAEAAIASVSASVSNWDRWGPDDARGTVNFIDADKRVAASSLVIRGETFSLSLPFDNDGPQNGWKRRVNPVHTMTSTGMDTAEIMGLPHGLSVADDCVFMPLQCSTQWDGLGHVFDHGIGWNNRVAARTVTSEGDLATGIEHVSEPMVSRGVLLDVGRVLAGGELPDGYAITPADLDATIEAQGASSAVGRGDILLVRTGQLTRVRRGVGWGTYAGGPAPGLSFTTAEWLHAREIAAVATDTWGVEVRPNEFPNSMQPLHQVLLPHVGLLLGEMWDLDRLAADCAADGTYEFLLAAQPLPFTGAVGSPVNPIAVK